jgi:hypothetical protein
MQVQNLQSTGSKGLLTATYKKQDKFDQIHANNYSSRSKSAKIARNMKILFSEKEHLENLKTRRDLY